MPVKRRTVLIVQGTIMIEVSNACRKLENDLLMLP